MSETGKAAVYVGPNEPMEIREYPVVSPGASDVLMRLEYSGICGTDIHILEGRLSIPPPFIPGHEFIGRIIETGSDAQRDAVIKPIAAGDYAIVWVAVPCGQCFNCRNNNITSCLNFGVTYVRDPEEAPHFFGGYGEYLHQPAASLIRIPEDVDVRAAAAFACAGPTVIRATGAAGALKADELVVVQGTGPVGLFSIAYAVYKGCRVVAIGSGSSKLRMDLARSLGADTVIDYRATSQDERIAMVKEIAREMDRGDGADVVIEATGVPSALPEGMQLTRTLGRYIIPGQYSNSGNVEIQPEIITFKALKITGSGQYRTNDISAYFYMLAKNPELQEKFAACITHEYEVADANEACSAVSSGEAAKAVFRAD